MLVITLDSVDAFQPDLTVVRNLKDINYLWIAQQLGNGKGQELRVPPEQKATGKKTQPVSNITQITRAQEKYPSGRKRTGALPATVEAKCQEAKLHWLCGLRCDSFLKSSGNLECVAETSTGSVGSSLHCLPFPVPHLWVAHLPVWVSSPKGVSLGSTGPALAYAPI